jgi:hypothetical protein
MQAITIHTNLYPPTTLPAHPEALTGGGHHYLSKKVQSNVNRSLKRQKYYKIREVGMGTKG